MILRRTAAAALLLAACHPTDPVTPTPSAPSGAPRVAAAGASTGEVVVEVNGVAVTRDELAGSTRPPTPHSNGAAPETEADTVQRVVLDELVAQRATQLGLDQDPTYREQLRQAEARHRVWKRQQLVELFERWQDSQRATVSEADARQWYAAHEASIRAEVRVGQILLRDEAVANQYLHDLQSGTAFDDVARRMVPTAGPSERPWELPYMRWSQVPEAWREPLQSLQVGQTTAVLRGPNRRFWILKLIDRRPRPDLTFEAVRDEVTQAMQAERAVAVRAGLREDLRRHAQINYHVQAAP